MRTLKKILVLLTLVTHVGLSFVAPAANAALVGTDAFMQYQQHEQLVTDLQARLLEPEVRDQLVAQGVDPDLASARIAALTDAELQMIHQHIGDLPAGGSGVIEVLGIVFLVLLILELVGVINIFKSF
jgi:hypothetical protein